MNFETPLPINSDKNAESSSQLSETTEKMWDESDDSLK